VSSAGDIEIRVSAHGRWVRVFAETEGRDVSRLSYAPQPLRLGPAGEISGLFTGTGIVAHRLYRRFGFVDTAIPTVAVKLLDPGEWVRRRVGRLLEDRALADWRCTLGVVLPPHAPVYVRVQSAQADLLPAAPARVDLTLTMTGATFLRLFEAEADVAIAEASREVQWRGAREHWETLCRALSARRSVVWEG
jgi:hypothetical protein